MCFALHLASPLTLSEIRSMLPPGLSADHASGPDRARLLAAFPAARDVVRLLAGRCSCAFVLESTGDPRADEAPLRARHRRLGTPRDRVIAALDRHRRGAPPARPRSAWTAALAGFVAEHARNAGPSLYLLSFADVPDPVPAPVELPAAAIRLDPSLLLTEDRAVRVSP